MTALRALLLVAALAVLALPAASSGSVTRTLKAGETFTTDEEFDKANPLVVTVSGVLSYKDTFGRTCSADAFYVFGECFGTRVSTPGDLLVGFETESFVSIRAGQIPGVRMPAYTTSHRYTFATDCSFHSGGCGQVKFFAGVGAAVGDAHRTGSFTITVGGFAPTSVLVRFLVQVSGPPNVEIAGQKPSPHGEVVRSTLTGFGTATFTTGVKGSNGKLLEATATSGTIVHDDVYADGTREHFEFGIISRPVGIKAPVGTFYAPQTKRLGLLLNVRNGGTDACPKGKLTLLTLNLVPGPSGFDGPGNHAILAGVPREYSDSFGLVSTNPCKGQARGWEPAGSADAAKRVTVRIGVKVPR